MRVLALVHKYPPVHNAGAEVMLHTMLRDLTARGHECIVTYPRAERSELDGIAILPTPPRDADLVAAARGCDALITHLDVTGRAMRVARDSGRPLVHLVHNDAQLDHHKVSEDRAALVVWNSEWIADSYRKWPGQSVIVRPPVPFDDYALAPGLYHGEDITLVNLTQAKGAPLTWQLARECSERTFLGVRGAYGTQVEPKRLPNVEVIGHLPAARMRDEVYARTRVLLVPSSYESWGRVAIEACCAGIPVIAHPTPGLLESLGSAGLFADRARPRDWLAHLERLDDPHEYRAASFKAIGRAEELDRVAKSDLDRFAVVLEDVVKRSAPASSEKSPMAILGSSSITGKACPICGAKQCACGGDGGVTIRPPSRRGLPVTVYRTALGDFRLNEDDARSRGLLPNGPKLATSPRRSLAAAGVDIEAHEQAYAGATDDARGRYLTELSTRRPRAIAEVADELLEQLVSGVAPPSEDPADPPSDDVPPINGRIGEVLAWAGETDPDRINTALAAERAARARPTLIAALEHLLEEL